MNEIQQKALCFLTALLDVYRDEERRELEAFSKIAFSEDATEDFTAMLLAMKILLDRLTGDSETDLIDFTHMLNKLAIQHIYDERMTAE